MSREIIEEAGTILAEAGEYTDKSVQVLRDAAHIRQNPGVYIGNTHTAGLHHLVYELVYNSVDEALAGYCKHIQVRLKVDGSVSVVDDGRGIPVEMHPKENRSTLEVVLTTVGAGAKFDNNAYRVSAGLHGMGAKAVTALSEWTQAEVRRNGRTYVQEYERGFATMPVKDIGPAKDSGTTITFKPDPEIFHDTTFHYDVLENRLRELAFLNRGLKITLHDERTGKEDVFHSEKGIAEYVAFLNRNEQAEHKVIHFSKKVDDSLIEIALQYTHGDDQRVLCFANNAYNPDGGTHLSGFRSGLTRTLNAYGDKEGLFKDGTRPTGEDFREGLTAIVNVQLADPLFESQIKVRLNNPEVEGLVASVVNEHLAKFLEENPKDAHRIINKVVLAARAREAARKAREQLIGRKSLLSGGGLPGKLLDCSTRERDAAELFLVEGDSAGGTAESGRDRHYQAVLPLRGKPLNVEKARLENLLKNDEICSIIAAVGIDIGNTDDLSKLRYGKIIILTDADVDGQHIRTLLLTFFFRQMRKLVEAGHIFVARPPLYKVVQKKQVRFVQTAEDMHRELMSRGLQGSRLHLHGERPRTLDGDLLTRLVLEVLPDLEANLQILERRGVLLSDFLARSGPHGLPMFRVVLRGKEHWFATLEEMTSFLEQPENQRTNGDGTGPHPETLHEVRHINRLLDRLREFDLSTADLVPTPRVAGREPPIRFVLESGDQSRVLQSLRELVLEVRRLGERGLSITRFKGLGEMDADELWETALDPKQRTLLKVTLEDAFKAEEMFRTLMGEEVRPRREFIDKYALEVKEIDYHGA